jgi:glycine/serine hydroxymethyltransferase
MNGLDQVFNHLVEHERKFKSSFSLIPSENMLSPAARLAYLSDGFSRYFFDENEVFGRWSFQGGSIVGKIQKEILFPLFKEVAKAEYIDVHPVSGLTGMTLALAAFGGEPGNHVFSVPVSAGGHPDTQYVAQKLGYVVHDLPVSDWTTLDLEGLAAMVEREKPSLVYFDQATALFPFDIAAMIRTVRAASSAHVHIHIDSSHVNGLIWGGHLPNPLECGADSYGGSTHKTFPGPHKAVLFTNDADIFERLTLTAVNMISHHHMSDVVALAITLLEFIECGGRDYVAQTVKNARAFAAQLQQRDFDVQGRKQGFTNNHQVWVDTSNYSPPYVAAPLLFDGGFIVNPYNPLPSLGGPGIRMGLNEATRLGLKESDMEVFADLFKQLLIDKRDVQEVAQAVAEMRSTCKPAYCYDEAAFREKFTQLCAPFGSAELDGLEAMVKLLYR